MRQIKLLFMLFLSFLLGGSSIFLLLNSEKKLADAREIKIFAHRGASDRYTESTITSYEVAAKEEVDALELDLRMTKDGEIIIMHDETIDRTTNGTGKVSELTLAKIKDYQTIPMNQQKPTQDAVPTLIEILDRFGDTETYYIETRLVDGQPLMEEPLIQILNDYELIEKNVVMVQSFSEVSLEQVARLAPEVPLTLLFGKGKFDLQKALALPYESIGMEASDVTNKRVEILQKSNKEVHVYFTNHETQKMEQKRIKEFFVDGYFTDFIPFTKELIQEENNK